MDLIVDSDIVKWYVIGTRTVRQEEKIRDELRKAGFRSHVPMRYEVTTRRGQEHRTMVPAISGLIFARGSYNELKDFIYNKPHHPFHLRKSTFSNKQDYLTVRDDVMEKFINFTNIRQEKITYFAPEELNLKEGETIRIKGGIYDGLEGTVLRLKGKRKKHIVVQIPGVVFAAIEIEPELVEAMPRSEECGVNSEIREKPSKDVEGDKKLMLELASWLLDNKQDKDAVALEYNLKLNELRRTRARLEKIKGFTPATEAELALPMFMASHILGEDIEPSKERLTKAIDRLKNTSKLKEKCINILNNLTDL